MNIIRIFLLLIEFFEAVLQALPPKAKCFCRLRNVAIEHFQGILDISTLRLRS